MLDIKDLNKDFHKHTVLQHLSLHLEGNELIYIHGINGSGKSTLFKLICDILKPTSGTIEKKKDLQIGALIENPGFLENETLAYNLRFLASLNNHYDQQYIEELCQQFHLDFHSRMKLKNFSVGMRQKAGIIQAIMEKQESVSYTHLRHLYHIFDLYPHPINDKNQVKFHQLIRFVHLLFYQIQF